MKESKWQESLVKDLRSKGAIVFNVHGHSMQSAGWPDLQVYHWIWTGHLELKVSRSASKSIPLQGKRIRDLRSVGTPACFLLRHSSTEYHVIDDVDPADNTKLGPTSFIVTPSLLLTSLRSYHGVLRSEPP